MGTFRCDESIRALLTSIRMPKSPRRVIITGAAGVIGAAISPVLASRWELTLTDVAPGAAAVLDITDLEACRAAFTDKDAVVHLAAVPDPDASWRELLPANVVGAYHVARAAADCGVRRLVLASSIQAVSGYPSATQVRASDAAYPANLYGATKAWSEALGAWIACSTATSVVALRIGFFAAAPPIGDSATPRLRSAWLSPRDCAELIRSAVEAEDVRFLVANGVSANRHLAADLSATMESLGYRPKDDAWRV